MAKVITYKKYVKLEFLDNISCLKTSPIYFWLEKYVRWHNFKTNIFVILLTNIISVNRLTILSRFKCKIQFKYFCFYFPFFQVLSYNYKIQIYFDSYMYLKKISFFHKIFILLGFFVFLLLLVKILFSPKFQFFIIKNKIQKEYCRYSIPIKIMISDIRN
jgi:hypothetical protein